MSYTPIGTISGSAADGKLLADLAAVVAGIGTPVAETLDRDLVAADNAKALICTGSRIFTVNAGMPAGFGVSARGTCSFASGTATVTDVRAIVPDNPWCALVQTGANTYDIVGGKL